VTDGVTLAEIFAVTVAVAFTVTFADVFVVTAVVGGFVVTFAGTIVVFGAVVWVVFWVGRTVTGVSAGAGVSSGDWPIPGIIPVTNAAMTARTMTTAIATRPHFRKGLRLFSCAGTSPVTTGVSAAGAAGRVFSREGWGDSRTGVSGAGSILSGAGR